MHVQGLTDVLARCLPPSSFSACPPTWSIGLNIELEPLLLKVNVRLFLGSDMHMHLLSHTRSILVYIYIHVHDLVQVEIDSGMYIRRVTLAFVDCSTHFP